MGRMGEKEWWNQCLEGLPEEVAKERRRVLLLLQAHESHLGLAYLRLMNLVANGVDLEEEMELPPEERAGGFDWSDE